MLRCYQGGGEEYNFFDALWVCHFENLISLQKMNEVVKRKIGSDLLYTFFHLVSHHGRPQIVRKPDCM